MTRSQEKIARATDRYPYQVRPEMRFQEKSDMPDTWHLPLLMVAALGLAGCCGEAGQKMDDLRDLEKAINDPEGYADKMDRDCDKGDAVACSSIGRQTAYGTYGRAKDPAAAIPFYEKGCELGDPHGCLELGVMYMYGRGVEEDHSLAQQLFEGACDEGASNACHYLGNYHERGEHVPKDLQRAKEYYDKACAAGDSSSCDRELL